MSEFSQSGVSPAAVISVSGSVTIGTEISVNNFPATQNVSGTVNIGTSPQFQISNFPATQNVSGSITVGTWGNNVTASVTGTVTIGASGLYLGEPSLNGGIPMTAPANIQDTLGWTVSLTGSLSASNGQIQPLKSDFQGNLANREQFAPVYEDNFNGVAAVAILPTTASLYTYSFSGSTGQLPDVVKAAPGVLYQVTVLNQSSGSVYLQAFNQTTLPAVNSVPYNGLSFIVVPTSVSSTTPGAGISIIDFVPCGVFFPTGISLGLSSSPFKYMAVQNPGSTNTTVTGSFSTSYLFK